MTASNQTYRHLPSQPSTGHRDAPIQVAGDGAPVQAIGQDLSQRLAQHVRAPVAFALAQKFDDRRLQLAQVQVEMLGLAQLGRGAVDLGARVDQLGGVQQVAAVIALVAAGVGVAADVAGAFHVAVGQEAPLGWGNTTAAAVRCTDSRSSAAPGR